MRRPLDGGSPAESDRSVRSDRSDRSDRSAGSAGSFKPGAPVKTEVESDDPFHAVAVQLPTPPGFDAMGEMARCMVEEYAMMGFSAPLLLKMFKNPFYQALHRVYEARGEEYVRGVLNSVFRPPDTPPGSDKSDMSNCSDSSLAPPNGSAPMPIPVAITDSPSHQLIPKRPHA